MKYKFIAVEGNIGAGKTTLAQLLAEKLNAQLVFEEFAHNPLLPAFYVDPETHAFRLELSFLADRCEQLRKLSGQNEKVIISDYIIDKSLVFARNNLKEGEYALFERIFHQAISGLPVPDLLIYINSPLNKLQQNILHRGRPYEQMIAGEYLTRIEELYKAYLETLTIPVLNVNADAWHSDNNSIIVNSLLDELQ
jgi:deoxyadenosine/deoxycytidine kinase